FLDLMPGAGLHTKGIIRSVTRPTTVKTRVIAQNQHLLRVDRETTEKLNPEETRQILQTLQQVIDTDRPDLILFQDYDKGVLGAELIEQVMDMAESNSILTAVDPKKANFWNYKRVTLFKPNLKEVRDSLAFSVIASKVSLSQASDYIREKLGNQHTLITLSEKGLFIDSADETVLLGTKPRTIADVCGAGDTVISIAAAALAAGASTDQIAQLSNLAGGQVCEKVGVVPVDRDLLIWEYLADSHQ
ncbi:MAG: carbohydrate kinase, partial [Saprospiraceae bacterium]|nr:carbohydrate kinase [Saprospiraceae bacterium]